MSDDEASTFTVEMESEEPAAALRVVLNGELDMSHATWVEDTLAAAAPHHKLLEIDLSQISFLDSTGVRTLLTLRQRAEILGLTTKLRNPSPAVVRTLTAGDLRHLIDG